MKLLRYLLSHGLFILILLVLALAYYYRTHLFPAQVNAQIDAVVQKPVAWANILSEKWHNTFSEQTEPQPVAEQNVSPQQPDTPMVIAADEPAVEPELPVPSTLPTQLPVINEEVPVQEPPDENEIASTTNETEATTEVAVAEVTEEQDLLPVEAPSPEVSEQAETATASSDDLLNEARFAFLQGQPDQAISLYKKLTQVKPDDPNVYGEMGNVFYSQGQWKQAGSAYYEAANRLLAQGQTGQVQYLYRVIQGLDQKSAEKLRQELVQ